MGLPLYLYYVGVTLVQIPLGFVFEGNILQNGSVLDDMTVTSVGQKAVDVDAEDQGWNTEWEW